MASPPSVEIMSIIGIFQSLVERLLHKRQFVQQQSYSRILGTFWYKTMLHCRRQSQQYCATPLSTIPQYFSLILIVGDSSQPFADLSLAQFFVPLRPRPQRG